MVKQYMQTVSIYLDSLIITYCSSTQYTGRFIMYCWITKIYNRKPVGHVFTKPVKIEGTTQKHFSQKVVFHRSSQVCRWVSVPAEIEWSPINH
jgi:hypothetical protein